MERRPWSLHEDGGYIQPVGRRIDDEIQGVLEKPERGGAPLAMPSCGSRVAEGEVLHSGSLGPHSPAPAFNQPPPQATIGSKRRPQAAVREFVGFQVLFTRWPCIHREMSSERAAVARSFHQASSRGEARRPLKRIGAMGKRSQGAVRWRFLEALRGLGARGVSARRKRSRRSRQAVTGFSEARA